MRGALAGLLAAGALGWLLSKTDAFPLPNKILAVLALGVVISVGWWVIGTIRALLRWVRELLHRRRVRRRRRLNLAAERARVRAPTFEIRHDEETVPLDGPMPPPRARFRMSQRQIADHFQQAKLATRQGDFRGAISLLSDVVQAAPDQLQARLERGRAYLAISDYNRAMNDFVAAEDLAPYDPEPPTAMGELYFARKDYARAIGSFDVALSLLPEQGMVHFLRGLSHFHRRNYPLALEDLLVARKLSPEIPNLETHVALAERKVKESERERARARRR